VAAIHQQMQQSLTCWERLLKTTSGALVPAKCFWYLIDFEYDCEWWKYQKSQHMPGLLQVHDNLGQACTIPRLETHKARRTLGVCIAPDGNWEDELTYLVSLAKKWQQKMRSRKLIRSDAIFSLQNVIYRQLVYLLSTT